MHADHLKPKLFINFEKRLILSLFKKLLSSSVCHACRAQKRQISFFKLTPRRLKQTEFCFENSDWKWRLRKISKLSSKTFCARFFSFCWNTATILMLLLGQIAPEFVLSGTKLQVRLIRLIYWVFRISLRFSLSSLLLPLTLPIFDTINATIQYKISTPLRIENPEKSPKVPPMFDTMSTVVTAAVFTILRKFNLKSSTRQSFLKFSKYRVAVSSSNRNRIRATFGLVLVFLLE